MVENFANIGTVQPELNGVFFVDCGVLGKRERGSLLGDKRERTLTVAKRVPTEAKAA